MKYNNGFVLTGSGSYALAGWYTRQHKPKTVRHLMKKEIVTHTITQAQVRDELKFLVNYFKGDEFKSCQVLFGYPWGLEYYSGDEWKYEEVELQNLLAKIQELEKANLGEIGLDDIFIKINDLEFRFCHDLDIHLSFIQVTPDVENFFSHWKDLGFNPTVWKHEKEHTLGKQISLNDA
jgi:hypothetical protein